MTPSTLQEIVTAVQSANDDGRKLRVLGSGHSWSPIASSSDILLSLVHYSGVKALDEEGLTVTVRGGTRLSQINAALSERGYALSILPSASSQTIAGAIMTGTVFVSVVDVCLCVCDGHVLLKLSVLSTSCSLGFNSIQFQIGWPMTVGK